MKTKVKLGILRSNISDVTSQTTPIFLTKHSFDCGWYWGFGYLGNSGIHFHIDSLLDKNFSDIFIHTKLNKKDWSYIKKRFKKAYSLRDTRDKKVLHKQEDLLNEIWEYLTITKKLNTINI